MQHNGIRSAGRKENWTDRHPARRDNHRPDIIQRHG
jgi:hypothetical protein